jgi:hypothetical protein
MPTLQNGVLRNRPRVNVTRGYTGNEPGNITRSAPLDASVTNAGVSAGDTIYSGQVMELTSAGKFKAATVATLSKNAYIAYHDSTDTDVDSCGKILGFSCLGNFEIESAWCVDVKGLAVGDPIETGAAGQFQDAGTETRIIGVVTEIRDLGVGGHTTSNPRGGVAGTIPEDSTANPYDNDTTATAGAAIQIVKFVVRAD